MSRTEAVREILNAFIGLFTQPFDQDLKASVTAAVTAITLAGLPGLGLIGNGGGRAAIEIGGASLVLVLVWMAVTGVTSEPEHRILKIARNLSVVSFWIAATLVFIWAAELLFPDVLDRAIRLVSVCIVLLVLVPVHMFRNLRSGRWLRLTLVLWISTGTLAWLVVY